MTSPPLASLDGDLHSFFHAVDQFFGHLASVSWGSLGLALFCFGISLTLRARAYFNVLRAAYPGRQFRFRDVWGAYVASFGFNSVVPARGGSVLKLFLVRTSVPGSTYPTIASSFAVEQIFELAIGIVVLIFAFSQGVFPKPPDFSKLPAFDLAYFASHPRLALFLITALGVLALVAFALLSARVRAFWARVRQGVAILSDRDRYFRQVFSLQLAGWLARFATFWFMLDAFHIGGSVRNVMLVFGVSAVASFVPFTPGGAGVQQALLVSVFGGHGRAATVAAYSVGQQIALAAFSFALGFAALVFIFRIRNFKEALRRGRESRAAEQGPERERDAEIEPRALVP